MRRPAAPTPLLLLLALLPGCATTPAAPADLSAFARQYRSDVPLRMLSVTTTNRGDAPVEVERVQLLAGGFVALPSSAADVLLQPGARVDIPAAYGAPRCGEPLPRGADAVRMRIRTGGGPATEVLLPLSPEGGLLPRLHASECAQAALQDAVEVALAPGWARRGASLVGSLVVRRRSGDLPVEVREPGGHIVFTVRAALPAVLAPGQQQLTVPLAVTATRCDGHALSQNSRSAVFPFVVAVGDGEPVQTPATAGAELQQQLQELARDTCVPTG